MNQSKEDDEKKVSEVIKRNRSFTQEPVSSPHSLDNQQRPHLHHGKHLSYHGSTSNSSLMTVANAMKTSGSSDAVSSMSNNNSELDWDKSEDFRRMIESDRMSVYDLNEQMAEIIRLKLLEFEAISTSTSMKSFPIMSSSSIYNNNTNNPNNRKGSFDDDMIDTSMGMDDEDMDTNSTNNLNPNDEFEITVGESDGTALPAPTRRRRPLSARRTRNLTNSSIASSEFTPADCLTMEDLFKFKLLSLEQSLRATSSMSTSVANMNPAAAAVVAAGNTFAPITFDIESLYASLNAASASAAQAAAANDQNSCGLVGDDTQNITFYHSMPDLRVFSHLGGGAFNDESFVSNENDSNDKGGANKSIKLVSKHASLLDMRSFEWIYIKREAAASISSSHHNHQNANNSNQIELMKGTLRLDLKPAYPDVAPMIRNSSQGVNDESVGNNSNTNVSSKLEVTGVDSETNTTAAATSGLTNGVQQQQQQQQPSQSAPMNFSRMSRLTMFRSYMSKLGEKVKQILVDVFSYAGPGGPNQGQISGTSAAGLTTPSLAQKSYVYNVRMSSLYAINEETVDSYDIIENTDGDVVVTVAAAAAAAAAATNTTTTTASDENAEVGNEEARVGSIEEENITSKKENGLQLEVQGSTDA